MLPFTREFQATVGEDFWNNDSDPRLHCRVIDGRACTNCVACDLITRDVVTYLRCDGPYLARSPHSCPACHGNCLGPITIDCFGVIGTLLAYLGPQYGAPLYGRLCEGCGQVWLSLYAADDEARRELAARFPSKTSCSLCGRGRLRLTRVDVPHSGFAGLYDWTVDSLGKAGLVAELWVAACDSCGEALTQAIS